MFLRLIYLISNVLGLNWIFLWVQLWVTIRVNGSCSCRVNVRIVSTFVNSNPTRILNVSTFANPNPTHLLFVLDRSTRISLI